mmetsp:Transcript_20244/g.35636  ORF Transcript_20244/g.35636 Transcript_20244/m.35636 type:complete len:92 (+) Transcript_20244:166-441(+)
MILTLPDFELTITELCSMQSKVASTEANSNCKTYTDASYNSRQYNFCQKGAIVLLLWEHQNSILQILMLFIIANTIINRLQQQQLFAAPSF